MSTVNINLRLPPDLHPRLKQAARDRSISLNTLIIILLYLGLEQDGGTP